MQRASRATSGIASVGRRTRSSDLERLLEAALVSPPHRREAALRVLLGEVEPVSPNTPFQRHEPYLTLRGLSRATGFSTSSLWRWRVPGVSFGGRQRYRLSDVQKYLGSSDFERRLATLRAERHVRSISGETGMDRPRSRAVAEKATDLTAPSPSPLPLMMISNTPP